MAQLAYVEVEIGKAVHQALQQLSNGLFTVARVAVHLRDGARQMLKKAQ
jgi:hypothetical protein